MSGGKGIMSTTDNSSETHVAPVHSKDIFNILPNLNISARIYLPDQNATPNHHHHHHHHHHQYKLPLLVYFHGGGFLTESAFSPKYHNHMNTIAALANIIVISVNYRLAPENSLPIAHEDSWLALKWVFSHHKGNGTGRESWLKNHVDFGRVYLGGDSAGANIAHNMAIRVGSDKTTDHGVEIYGMFLNCPFFWGVKRIGKEATDPKRVAWVESIWKHTYPNSTGFDDPLTNPASDPNLWKLGCKRVMVYFAGNDILRDRGSYYVKSLRDSKWDGIVKRREVRGEDHVFNILHPYSDKANKMLNQLALFLQDKMELLPDLESDQNQIETEDYAASCTEEIMSSSTDDQINSSEVLLYEIIPFVRVYKDGTIERMSGTETVAPVQSKDIFNIVPNLNISVRIYLPQHATPNHHHHQYKQLPLLVYFHGGGFQTGSPFSPCYHDLMNTIVAQANIIIVSVNYRLAPENLLPIAHDDSWLALKWVFSHHKGNGREPWLKNYVDFGRVYLGGDSAGGNIAHNMAIRVGLVKTDLDVVIEIYGMFLIYPFFWGAKRIGNEARDPKRCAWAENIWNLAYPNSTGGFDDPLINPVLDPNLWKLGCKRVVVYYAGTDILRDRGSYYVKSLRESKWDGIVKGREVRGEDHAFNLISPYSHDANKMLNQLAMFLQDKMEFLPAEVESDQIETEEYYARPSTEE